MEQRLVVSGKELIKIAKVTSSIGIKGGVKITPLFFNTEETIELIQMSGDSIYLHAESIFPKIISIKEFSKSKGGILLSIAGLDSIEKARACIGMFVLIEYKFYSGYLESTDNVLRYLGYKVVDRNLGNLGIVSGVNRQLQILLEVDGEDSIERLIPFVKELVEEVNHKDRIIRTNLPCGIFE